MFSRQISLRLLRTFLLSWIVYNGICSATKIVEAALDISIPTSMPTIKSSSSSTFLGTDASTSPTTTRSSSAPTIRSSPTPTIQSVDYTVMQVRSLEISDEWFALVIGNSRIFCSPETMQAISGIDFTSLNKTIFKNTLQTSVANILAISSSAVKLMSVAASKRRKLAQDMERLPSLAAIGVDAIYIVTATRTNTSTITNTIISKRATLTKALVTAGFVTASPQLPSVATFQKLSPSAAPSELKTTSAAFPATNSYYAVVAFTFALVLIQTLAI